MKNWILKILLAGCGALSCVSLCAHEVEHGHNRESNQEERADRNLYYRNQQELQEDAQRQYNQQEEYRRYDCPEGQPGCPGSVYQ